MKFSIKDFFSKCYQIRIFLRIWSTLLKKSFIEEILTEEKLHFLCSELNATDYTLKEVESRPVTLFCFCQMLGAKGRTTVFFQLATTKQHLCISCSLKVEFNLLLHICDWIVLRNTEILALNAEILFNW